MTLIVYSLRKEKISSMQKPVKVNICKLVLRKNNKIQGKGRTIENKQR